MSFHTKKILFASFLLVSFVACNSRIPSEILNPTATFIPIKATTTSSILVLPTASDKPFQRLTPVNENQIVPTPIGQVTQTKSFDLYDKRIKGFENTLEFHISDTGINLYTNKNNTSMFIVNIQGILKNITDKSLVVRRELRTGLTLEPEIYLEFTYNNKSLAYFQCCVDGFLRMKQDDYVVLPPGKSRIYIWSVPLLLTMNDTDNEVVSLSGKSIKISALYISTDVGFSLQDHKGNLITSQDKNGDSISYVVDINMWLGKLKSNEITVRFP